MTSSSSQSVAGDAIHRLPPRLFGTDQYPLDGRINSYSKLQYLIDIVDILHGSQEYEVLMNSSLGGLFRLPVVQCSLNGKLVHHIVCRQVLSANDDDAWFTFGGFPIRFSLSEFEVITGLNCGPYPPSKVVAEAQSSVDKRKPYLDRLIGRSGNVTIAEIVALLRNQPDMPRWRRIRLAMLVIVEGILICGTQPVCASIPIAEMLKDMDFFLRYPWGRLSFMLTIRMMKVGARVDSPEELVSKLKKTSMALHGFPIAIQLLCFRQIPALLDLVPGGDDLSSFLDRTIVNLPIMKAFHTSNILSVENNPKLKVLPVALGKGSSSVSSNNDPCVTYLEDLIRKGHKFQKSDWDGGDSSLPQLCTCGRQRHGTCSCLLRYQHTNVSQSVGVRDQPLSSQPCQCKNLLRMLKDFQLDQTVITDAISKALDAKMEQLQSSLLSEINGLVANFQCSCFCKSKGPVGGSGYCTASPLAGRAAGEVGQLSNREASSSETHSAESVHFEEVAADVLDSTRSTHTGVEVVNGTTNHGVVATSVADCASGELPSSSVAAVDVRSLKRRKYYVLSQARVTAASVEEKKKPVIPDEVGGADVASDPCVQLYASTTGFCPFPRSSPALVAKFRARLRDAATRSVVVSGEEVRPDFLLQIVTPQQWLSNLQVDAMISTVWRERSSFLMDAKLALADCYFTQYLCRTFSLFEQSDMSTFEWPSSLRRYVLGHIPDREEIRPWVRDVHVVYAPMNWGLKHWVMLVINFRIWHVDILDPYIAATRARQLPSLMAPVVKMLPHLVAAFCPPGSSLPMPVKPFTFTRVRRTSQNERSGDCGALAVKFMELHSHGQVLTGISEAMVTEMRLEYALKIMSHSSGPLT